MNKSNYIIVVLLFCMVKALALDKEEVLFFATQNDTLFNNSDSIFQKNLVLSRAFMVENPEKALIYSAQAIDNTDNPFLKAGCYLQNGIIYNYDYSDKNESSLENLFAAKEIYRELKKVHQLIFTEILIGEVYRKFGDKKRAAISFEEAFNSSLKIDAPNLAYFAFLAQIDLTVSKSFPIEKINLLIHNLGNLNQMAYSFFLGHKRALKNNNLDFAIQFLDSAEYIYETNKDYGQAIEMLITKAELFEILNNTQKVVQLNELIYQKSVEYSFGKGIIYSCYKLSDFFESIDRYQLANQYLKYLNKIKSSEGEKELAEKISLAEKEKKIDLERINAKNEVTFQGYLTFFGFGVALLLLAIAIYIYFAYKTKSQLANDLLVAYNNNEELKKEKDNFLAYTSHEIRTPLSAVLTASEILSNSSLNKQQESHLNTLKSSANSILFLVNDILDLAKLEKRKIELENIPFSPVKVIENGIKILNSKAYNNGVDIKFICSENIPKSILGDSFRFQQIVINLLDNAIKYSPNGIVEISIKLKTEHYIEVIFKDNGKGIDEQKLKQIFKPYTQEKSNTSRQYGGTGLGLAICDLLIQLMNGKISAKSNESGSTFSFQIPFVIDSSSNIEDFKKLKELKILMVEDDLVNGQLFKDMITNEENKVHVTWVKNGVEALKEIENKTYDAVLMDLEMPLKNGYQTSKEIRSLANKKINNIPIIAMTAHVLDQVLEKCYENGINDCIAKPFQLDVLQRKIMTLSKKNSNKTINDKTIDRGRYLDLFISSFKIDFKKLEYAVKEKNEANIKYLLHKMKGATLTMEYNDLANLFFKMEQKKLVDLSDYLVALKKIFKAQTGSNL